MADDRTTATELATALGMTEHTTLEAAVEARPDSLEIGAGQWAGLCGLPEAKVYLDTPHAQVPGYRQLDQTDEPPPYGQERLIDCP